VDIKGPFRARGQESNVHAEPLIRFTSFYYLLLFIPWEPLRLVYYLLFIYLLFTSPGPKKNK